MNYQIPVSLDLTQDICEIGLLAAASPEFAERLVLAMLGADNRIDSATSDCPVDVAAAGCAGA